LEVLYEQRKELERLVPRGLVAAELVDHDGDGVDRQDDQDHDDGLADPARIDEHLKWIHLLAPWILVRREYLLTQPEIDANGVVDGHGTPALLGGLVLPLLDRLDGGIVEHRVRAAEDGDLADVAFLVDDGLEDDLALDARAARDVGVGGIDLLDEDRQHHV